MGNDKKSTRNIWKMFKILIAITMVVMMQIFITNLPNYGQKFPLKDIYIKNSFKETGSPNVVTGIYLDYRLYDSLFESLLLLVTVSAISYINKTDFDV